VLVACKAAREKFEVWKHATDIMEAIESACDKFSRRTRDRDAVKEILGTTADVINGELIKDSRYIELNTSVVSGLQVQEQLLKNAIAYAEAVLKLVRTCIETGVAPPRTFYRLGVKRRTGRRSTMSCSVVCWTWVVQF